MKVKDLINRLQELDPEAIVCTEYYDNFYPVTYDHIVPTFGAAIVDATEYGEIVYYNETTSGTPLIIVG